MQVRHFPPPCFERRRRRFAHRRFYGRQSPHQNKQRKNRERQPSLGNLSPGVVFDDFFSRQLGGVLFALIRKSPHFFRLPETQERQRGHQRNYARGDVHQIAVHIIGPKKLRSGERNAHH